MRDGSKGVEKVPKGGEDSQADVEILQEIHVNIASQS